MIDALAEAFRRELGRAPELAARAPGRVNLIGEHTDYNDGLVLPCAIDRATFVVGARRDDGRFRVRAHDLDETAELAAPTGAEPGPGSKRNGWVSYLEGVLFALAERGLEVPGFDAIVASTVPRASGLSSSAALEVAFVTALDAAYGLGLSALERARVAHRAETAWVGVACGLMDQLASALGRAQTALRIDCRSLEVQPIRLPAGLRLLLFDSGMRRELAGGAYNRRRAECEAALAAARAAGIAPQARALRDLAPSQLGALEGALEPLLLRRARHVITENARVDEACAAFARGDLASAGAVLKAGMRSLRDDFEVSLPELDALCELGDATPGVYGSRLTGAGFGGCTVHLVAAGALEGAADAIATGFEARFGRRPPAILAHAADGASEIALAARPRV